MNKLALILVFQCFLGNIFSQDIPGKGLAKLISKIRSDFWIGSNSGGIESADGEYLKKLFIHEFNILTIGVYMHGTQPKDQAFRFDRVDGLVKWAMDNKIKVYFHPLVGGNEYNAAWLNNGNFTPEELGQIMKERITTLLKRYGDKVTYVDVVNEPIRGLDSDGNIRWNTDNEWMKMGWYEGKKHRLPKYLVEAYKIAREAGHKNLKLILNLYGNCTPDANMYEASFKLAEMMRDEGIPIDGVGLQMHTWLYENGDVVENGCGRSVHWNQEGFAKVLKRYSDAGYELHITEFDVHIHQQPATEEQLALQGTIYRQVLEEAIKCPAVKTFKTWGFNDKYSWKDRNMDATPLLFDKNFSPKPAYTEQVKMLKELAKK